MSVCGAYRANSSSSGGTAYLGVTSDGAGSVLAKAGGSIASSTGNHPRKETLLDSIARWIDSSVSRSFWRLRSPYIVSYRVRWCVPHVCVCA